MSDTLQLVGCRHRSVHARLLTSGVTRAACNRFPSPHLTRVQSPGVHLILVHSFLGLEPALNALNIFVILELKLCALHSTADATGRL